ncbi:MAG: hypothetical protein P8012_15370 [Desulfobacterales bacterium]
MRTKQIASGGKNTRSYPGRLLAIDPGSNKIGVAYFKGGELEISAELRVSGKDIVKRLEKLKDKLTDFIAGIDAPEMVVVEFGGSIRMKGKNPHGIRTHDFAAGFLASSAVNQWGVPFEIIPPLKWKGNVKKTTIQKNMSLIYSRKLGEDEAHAIGLGRWFLAVTRFNQLINY